MTQKTHSKANLYLALELSNQEWTLRFGDGTKSRQVTVAARDQVCFWREVSKAKAKFGMSAEVPVFSCYEAGRDGFWIHHMLTAGGVTNLVMDSASIEVNRRAKQVKTDRVDAKKLLGLLVRYWRDGDTSAIRIVRVPRAEDEAHRRLHRNAEHMKKEKRSHLARMRSLLVLQGINPTRLPSDWREVKDWAGQPLAEEVIQELEQEQERLTLVNTQLLKLAQIRKERMKAAKQSDAQTTTVSEADCWSATLSRVKSVGEETAWILSHEFFGWRTFENRRQVGAAAGLTGSPYSSGDSHREQGISKAGNARVRHLMTEMAWRWLRFQPQSALAQWYQRRFGSGPSRLRRVGIVALSRKLLIALWKYGAYGQVPEGAIVAN